MTITCLHCHSAFKISSYYVKLGRKYCTIKCYGKAQGGTVERRCTACNRIFFVQASRAKEGRGKQCSKPCANEAKKGAEYLTGENNWNWKGDAVGNKGLHYWVYRQLGAPQRCDFCGTTEDRDYEWANKSHLYKRDLADWLRLCIPCHKRYDLEYLKRNPTRTSRTHKAIGD